MRIPFLCALVSLVLCSCTPAWAQSYSLLKQRVADLRERVEELESGLGAMVNTNEPAWVAASNTVVYTNTPGYVAAVAAPGATNIVLEGYGATYTASNRTITLVAE